MSCTGTITMTMREVDRFKVIQSMTDACHLDRTSDVNLTICAGNGLSGYLVAQGKCVNARKVILSTAYASEGFSAACRINYPAFSRAW